MDSFSEKLITLLDKPENYLRPDKDLRKSWSAQAKSVYDFMKKEEGFYKLSTCDGALKQLYIDGLDDEQIWQLVDLQNDGLLAASDDMDDLSDANLCYMVAKLSSLARYDRLDEDGDTFEDFDGGGDTDMSDEGSELEEQEEDEDEEEGEDEEDEDEAESGDDMEDSLDQPMDVMDSGLDTNFDMDTDDEVDNFDDLIAVGEESEDSEADDKVHSEEEDDDGLDFPIEEPKKKEGKARFFEKSTVDSDFFNLRESEWVADNDKLGDNYDADAENIDLMAEMSDDGEELDAMYKDFFDAPSTGQAKNKPSKLKTDEEEEEEEEEEEDEDDDDRETELNTVKEKPTKGRELENASDSDESDSPLGNQLDEKKSTFEMQREREKKMMGNIEEDLVRERPWHLQGEASAKERPQNSALEEHMEYNIGMRHKPVITEDVTSLIEKVLMTRVRNKAWDDVERKVKPTVDPFEYKKKLILDQEKSKLSLAEIYEKEYLKQTSEQKDNEQEEEPKEHVEIRKRMDELFSKLDALSHYHYTPKMLNADVKIQSNLPAITMEDATPITMSDATTLAPQEVLAPAKDMPVGKTERTATDRKHAHRVKKAHQKKKAKAEDLKLREKLKKAGSTGKLDSKTSVKVVEKAVKDGHVKLLEGQQNKALKSSQQFFKQLQENKSEKNKNKQKNKKNKNSLTAAKVLL